MSARLETALAAAARAAEVLVGEGVLSGAVVAAVDGAGALAEQAVGATSQGRSLVPSDRMLTTSITKAITALQVMMLVDEGRVDLEAPVGDLLTEFVGDGKDAVRVTHLLSHSSGLSQRANVAEGPPTDLSSEELERYAIATPLSRQPGEVEYCSPAFWLLAAILRRRSGEDHVTHLRRRVTGPLGIPSEALDYHPGDTPPDGLVPAIADHNAHLAEQVRRIAYPAGGVIATAAGLARLGAELVRSERTGRGLLSPAAVRAIATPRSYGVWPDGRRAVWGLGMELAPPGSLWSDPTLFHSGASGTALWVDLGRGVALSLLTADWYIPRTVHSSIADAFCAALSREDAAGTTDPRGGTA